MSPLVESWYLIEAESLRWADKQANAIKKSPLAYEASGHSRGLQTAAILIYQQASKQERREMTTGRLVKWLDAHDQQREVAE